MHQPFNSIASKRKKSKQKEKMVAFLGYTAQSFQDTPPVYPAKNTQAGALLIPLPPPGFPGWRFFSLRLGRTCDIMPMDIYRKKQSACQPFSRSRWFDKSPRGGVRHRWLSRCQPGQPCSGSWQKSSQMNTAHSRREPRCS